ncbi:hypothetical protein PMAYCL1PPCAC_19448, partial [Pristionchus mayeri]
IQPTLTGKKIACEQAGTVMRVNDQLEFDHLQCSRDFWTKSDETQIPRKTHDEKINVACVSRCDHSFVHPSSCVDDGTCNPVSS